MKYIIREVKISDYEQFNIFCYEMYCDKSNRFPLAFEAPPSIIYTKKQFITEIKSALEINLICLKENNIIGFIQADIKEEEKSRSFEGYKYADVRNFYIKKKYDSNEIRKKMYLKLERLAKNKSLDKIAVMNFGELHKDNFYLQQSFYPYSINYVKYFD